MSFLRKRRTAVLSFLLILAAMLGLPLRAAGATLNGTVYDAQGKPVAGQAVQIYDAQHHPAGQFTTDASGGFDAGTLPAGDYSLQALGNDGTEADASLQLSAGAARRVDLNLASLDEAAVVVTAHRNLIRRGSSSSQAIQRSQIQALPGGASVSLTKLLTSTDPGMVQGSFGQVFTRGNHADLQVQVDGVQLPDSVAGSFGDAFNPRNIERMDVITGGLPAEYGDRLAGVLKISTRSGPQRPGGELDLSYGAYNRFAPHADLGGSTPGGGFRYFLSAGAFSTQRGLDTPQPASATDDSRGGEDAVHDYADGQNQFAKLDWAGAADRLTLDLSNAHRYYQIPNLPSSFASSDPYFSSYTDAWGNGPFDYRPAGTGDDQTEQEDMVLAAWRHDLGGGSWLQVAPYWKVSSLDFHGDPANDLASAALIPGSTPSSFSEDRRSNDGGLKADWLWKAGDALSLKSGLAVQGSQASGPVSVMVWDGISNTVTSSQDSVDAGEEEGAYTQAQWKLGRGVAANLGLRYDATQFQFSDASSRDGQWQPRVGLSWAPDTATQLHAYYGRLFMPAPVEDLRASFAATSGGGLKPYDIKAEKDNYTEAGVDQQVGGQLLGVTGYYKDATDMLDDTQLLNTAIVTPFNFASGFAYGVEATLKGSLGAHWSDFASYSYEIAKGQGISGGIFAFDPASLPPNEYQYLDHVQIHSANAGLTWQGEHLWASGEALYGSGLRTGSGNDQSLPQHLTFDATLGWGFQDGGSLGRLKASLDVLNISDDAYAITIANGFNGSHYAAGRTVMAHLSQSF